MRRPEDHKLSNHPSRGRMFLKLRKMTLDKSPSGSAIEPQFEDTEDEFEKGRHEPSPLPSRTKKVRATNETDGDWSLSADLGEDVTRLKAVSAETSVELEAQRRDIDRVSAVVRRLERDISQMKDIVETIRSEAITRSTDSALPRREGMGYPVEELELLTANITSLGSKVNGMEGLKLEFEMMKRRIRRMEDANNATQSTSTLAAFPQPSLQSTPVARITRPTEESSQRKRTESIPRLEEYDESNVDPPKSVTPEDGPANRNFSASRSSEGLSDQQERPRSSTLDKLIWDKSIPRYEEYNESNVDPPKSATPEDVPADGNFSASRSSEGLRDNQERPRSSTLDKPIWDKQQLDLDDDKASGSGHGGSEAQGENQKLKHTVSPIFVTPAKRRATKGAEQFFSYDVPIIDNSQDDDYKPHSRSTAVRGASNSPRARKGSRGRGRGGRSRTGLTRQYGTPEWEKPDWVDGSSEHQKDTGSTSASKRGGGVSRRGTGGGSYSEPRRAPAQDSMDRTSPQEDPEVYRLTPRSTGGGGSKSRPREQRQRDSEGYLLTAKGTRDGRSQFWKDVGAGLKPNPNVSEDKRAANPSRHAKIMQQIFPDGVEEGKRRSNLAQQLFSRDKSSNGANGELDTEIQRGPDAVS